jgi:flavin-dependent dehydrogenase
MKRGLFDVAVIGGGPAGCSAAIHLARAGARVVLYEAQTYPHDKVCGEFLSPECAGLLASLGLAAEIQAFAPVPIHSACITAPDGINWETPLPAAGIGLSRRTLDAALAQAAERLGVDVRPDTNVIGVEGDLRSGFQVRTRQAGRGVPAQAVIAAHGKRSSIDRVLNRPFMRREHPFMGLKTHFKALPGRGRVELYGLPGGYCGVSCLEGGTSVVSVLVDAAIFQKASAQSDQDAPEAFYRWMRAQNPQLSGRLAGAEQVDESWQAIAQVAFDQKSAVEGDILMAGDAAGLIAPLAGDGIAMALRSGELAAQHLSRFLTGRASAGQLLHGYACAWQGEFGRRLRLARFLQAFLLRPRLLSPGLRLAAMIPALGRALVRGTRGS